MSDLIRILHIETSTKNCSVSISENGSLVYLKELNSEGYSHAEKLHPFILDCMQRGAFSFKEIHAISVGKGPGSYTGLRIGVSAAKGLCFANNIPLIAVNSLEILARACSIDQGLIVPMIDARRMEVYAAVFDSDFKIVRETMAEIIDASSFYNELENSQVFFLGDGIEKCKKIIHHPHANFIDDVFPSAKHMATISYQKFLENNFEDVAYFEPYYLKDFVASPQKNGLKQ